MSACAASPPALTEAARQLAEANIPLAIHVAGKFRTQAKEQGLPFDDVVSEALAALAKAAGEYDPGQGQFSTWAWACVFQRLRNFVGGWRRWRRLPVGWDGALLAEPEAPPEADPFAREDARLEVERLLPCLSTLQREVVGAYFGLGGAPRASIKELARQRGVCCENVCAVLRRAIKTMRRKAGVADHAGPERELAGAVC